MLPIPDLLQQAQLTPTAMQADMLRAATATDGAAHLLPLPSMVAVLPTVLS